MVKFAVMTFNVNGLGDAKKRRRIFHKIHESKIDFVFLQETHSTINDEPYWQAEWGAKIFFSHGTSKARGVALLTSKKVKFVLNEVQKDEEGRMLNVALQIEHNDFVLSSLYAPNADSPEFFHRSFANVSAMQGYKILGGDFNTVLNLDKDIKGGKGHSNNKTREATCK